MPQLSHWPGSVAACEGSNIHLTSKVPAWSVKQQACLGLKRNQPRVASPKRWMVLLLLYHLQAWSLISSINCDANLLDLANLAHFDCLASMNPLRVMQVSFPELSFLTWKPSKHPISAMDHLANNLSHVVLKAFP